MLKPKFALIIYFICILFYMVSDLLTTEINKKIQLKLSSTLIIVM